MSARCSFFFFNDTATTEIYTLSLHDALPICRARLAVLDVAGSTCGRVQRSTKTGPCGSPGHAVSLLELLCPQLQLRLSLGVHPRSEEHTSELQSRQYLVCRLLLEKKKKKTKK